MDNWEAETLNISGIVDDSIVDGPGLRYTIFVQGCPHGCPECHNPQTHSFEENKRVTLGQLMSEIKENPLLYGVTFSGGEPFCQPGAAGDSWSADKEGRHASDVLQWLYV